MKLWKIQNLKTLGIQVGLNMALNGNLVQEVEISKSISLNIANSVPKPNESLSV